MRYLIAVVLMALTACATPQEIQAKREQRAAEANAQIARIVARECADGTEPVKMHVPRPGYQIEYVRQHCMSRSGAAMTLLFDEMGNLTDTIRFGK